ncbi:uncharacterized protein LOC18439326 [Amborella trichopoda]|uniref:Uncharacterized protein n=1 Tax=Amborella trichopoda TaxID=13333 RepID=W1PM86_AMBTC|nr:uncharacterized protein LOC18439326 [Amborella trichopoda]ERN11137.1 hypothetical protein AMTR_s00024p00178520 [Amborella trichopoda]|eukprot:XP_006849556.1 uncharacterized protein LOC18439326 [Amborella trichopoda]
MPGLMQRNAQFAFTSYSNVSGSVSSNGIWSRRHDDVTLEQLHKFWSELPPNARQELLRIDKQTLFEQARKNLYCSRCNGLLLEGFYQIVMYGKSLQQEGGSLNLLSKPGVCRNPSENGSGAMFTGSQDDIRDPAIHPWGGLATTRDGILTLLDCFLEGKSLDGLQIVFDSARARERERELLYPDACGGGGRGWISQGMVNYGRGHGTRESCALHTARLSCETLVDFWSALGDETRLSLLRMKEEDFIERLMYRFDSKRFCRDCRRNVMREFKELKELKRMRKEPQCTNWFCVADTAFQYEVSNSMIRADWRQSFAEMAVTYHHFEWAVGTGEGKCDILGFEDVGMSGNVQVDGLDLGGLNSCFITLRAWKLDGRCSEISVKAHALKGQACVHRRLIVGDGFVSITKGESIKRFFEHAEEAEEEEDDDSMDKDGNELDGEGSRPQKHAKSPELAREFLLDAATVIFKEQVEKAFREGTARQNAHSLFVCLALGLLEERVHVACKEIITLEKQMKLLEEEEREKREDEERRERKKLKEREKKQRRKEKLKGKEKQKEKAAEQSPTSTDTRVPAYNSSLTIVQEESTLSLNSGNIETEDDLPSILVPLDNTDTPPSAENTISRHYNHKTNNTRHASGYVEVDFSGRENNGFLMIEQSKYSRRKLKPRKDSSLEPPSKWFPRRGSNSDQVEDSETMPHNHMGNPRSTNGVHRQQRSNFPKINTRSYAPKHNSEKSHCSNSRSWDRYDSHSCSCNPQSDSRFRDGQNPSITRTGKEMKMGNKSEPAMDMTRPYYRSNKYNSGGCLRDGNGVPKGRPVMGSIPVRGDASHIKKVWEPLDPWRRCPKSSLDMNMNGCQSENTMKSVSERKDLSIVSETSGEYENARKVELGSSKDLIDSSSEAGHKREPEDGSVASHQNFDISGENEDGLMASHQNFDIKANGEARSAPDPTLNSTSGSDNGSSCSSEGDSSSCPLGSQNAECSSVSDSEETTQSEGRDSCSENGFRACSDIGMTQDLEATLPIEQPVKPISSDNNKSLPYSTTEMRPSPHHVHPVPNPTMAMPVFPAHSMGYYQSSTPWAPSPNGLVPFIQPSGLLFSSPLSYGLPQSRSSRFCTPYGTLQPFNPIINNVGHIPSFPMKTSAVNPKEQTKNLKFEGLESGVRGFSYEASVPQKVPERPFSKTHLSSEGLLSGQDGNDGKPQTLANTNFSFFHFGGPLAAGEGYNPVPIPLKEEIVGDENNKRDSILEEYSLFASGNGNRFSFF